MDISERNSYMAKPKEGFEPSPDGGEAAGKPGHFERSSLRRLSVVRKPEDCDDDGHIRRTGNVITASAGVITAVIGAGVLSLAWCSAQLGWVGGIVTQLLFAVITLYTSFMLCDKLRFPHPTEGERTYTYPGAVRLYLGKNFIVFCGVIQHLNLVSTSIGYTVTSGIAMASVYRAHCYHYNQAARIADNVGKFADPTVPGDTGDPCYPTVNKYMIIFGCIELLFIQIPDMDRLWWLSIVAAIMSFVYATIGVGLSISRATQHDHPTGTIQGAWHDEDYTPAYKTWNIMLALGNVAFAYSFSYILIEIGDTMAAPNENKKMKRSAGIGIGITTFYYVIIGTVGYAAFGNEAPGNLLTGFGYFEPWWLIMLANLAIVIHLIGGYQIWTQPFLCMVENSLDKYFPNSKILQSGINIPIPRMGTLQLPVVRLIWRSVYVCIATFIAILAPFFNDIVGVMGSLGFWPLTVFLPVEMHIVQKQIPRWSTKWCLLQTLSGFCLLISVAAMIGSIAGVYLDTREYSIFHAPYG